MKHKIAKALVLLLALIPAAIFGLALIPPKTAAAILDYGALNGPAFFRGLIIWSIGHSTCTFRQSLHWPAYVEISQDAGHRLRANSKKIVEDPAARIERWVTPRGEWWISTGSEGSLFYELWEQDEDIYGDANIGVRPGDIVLDVGAQYGLFTRKAISRGARTVVAIEPAPDHLECLRRNFTKEIAAGQVILYPKGAWDKDDRIEMHRIGGDSGTYSFVGRSETGALGLHLPLTTIDKIAAELSLPRVDFIKMDIEGAERNALLGARAVLLQHRPRLAIAGYHRKDDPVAIPASLPAGLNYRMECRRCKQMEVFIRPEVLHFY
jgi:FkbM family methyltransferase